jgi:hypothetical protein
MRLISFRCPVEGRNIELIDCEGDEARALYRAIVCPACARLHFVKSTSGELLSGR